MLINHYFAAQPVFGAKLFRRRYRMRQNVFLKLYNAVVEKNDYFHQKYDALGVPGPSGLIKATCALRLLSYGCPADSLDESINIGEQTALNSLKHFSQTVVDIFENEYLRTPTPADVERLLAKGAQRGFPGMLGSIDCMHWIWKNCPTAEHGQHMGHHKKATVILEAVADHELWIWHAFFGTAGSCNDLNVLENSHVFDDMVNGRSPPCNYQVNGNHYNMGYYLSDGIYPQWATLIQTERFPGTRKKKVFAKAQEAVRKDVERAFGVLQARFAMVARPARTWNKAQLGIFMKACLIMHNMIIEDERDIVLPKWKPPRDEPPLPVIVELQSNDVDE
ncbi:putative nuclease HARBI1, partial [Alexandromys fortis]|uniref:putative nuclease HARBI1 n=1 Tax=Alexandromys fortis TaxID=100897 RepID=UPI002152FAA7